MDYLVPALGLVLQPDTLLALILASLFGFIVGALPGLTATMAVALLVPITFLLSPLAAIASIVAASAMAIFAGDIPGALLRIPGTPASAAYVEEAYKLTLAGRAGYVLGVNATCSMIGGVFGTAVLILAAPLLADVALNFSAFEFFWLSLLGLSCGAFVARDAPLKGGIAMLIGLLIANRLLLPFGWIAIRLAKLVLCIPRDLLMPALFILAIVGAFAIYNDFSGVWIMLCLGAVAYVLEECGFPIAPIVLGIVLGNIVEQNLVQALISTQGNLLGFFDRPVSAVLGVLTILIWSFSLLRWAQRRWRPAAT